MPHDKKQRTKSGCPTTANTQDNVQEMLLSAWSGPPPYAGDNRVLAMLERNHVGMEEVPLLDNTNTPNGNNHAAQYSSEVSSETDEPLSALPKKRRKVRAKPVHLDEDVEWDLVKWYKNNPILYNRALREFKNVAKKNSLYEEMGRSMRPRLSGILHFYNLYVYTFLKFHLKNCSSILCVLSMM